MLKKLNTKFTISDCIIVLFCIAGTVASGWAFLNEYNRTLVKLNDEPVGTITFKKNTAQRKFSDREIWDRLKQATPIYNGDTIRTVEQSEAVVIFKDQITHLNLDEGTLIQIFFDEFEGGRIDFFSGNLEVISSSKGIVISSGGSEIKLEGRADIKKNEDGLGLSVLEGQASFAGKEIETGGILTLDNRGTITEVPAIAVTSFGPSARILGTSGTQSTQNSVQSTPVVFSWNTSNFRADTYVIVEVASDRGFNRITETRDVTGAVSVSIPLGNGNYWWRAYPANSGSREPVSGLYPSGTMEVIPVTATTLLSPAPAAEIIFSDISQVPLSWSASENAVYTLEISANADMRAPVVTRRVERNSVTQTGLENGQWFWRVTPVFPARYIGSAPPSAVGEFSLVRGRPTPAEPVLTLPANNGTVDLDAGGRRLMWSYDPLAVSWDVELSENPNMTNPVRQNVVSNYFPLPQEVLRDGKTWYWRISAIGGGTTPVVSATRNFTVISRMRPPVESAPPVRETPPPVAQPPAPPENPVLQPEESPILAQPSAALPPAALPPTTPPAQPVQPPPQQPTPTAQPPVQPPPPEQPAAVQPPPEQPVRPQPTLPQASGNLLRLAREADRSVTGASPSTRQNFTIGQLAAQGSIRFTWRGNADEYRFALYRHDGVEVVSPVTITDPSYTFRDVGKLQEGTYVWQVYEKNRRGEWDLPSIAYVIYVLSE